MSADNIIIESLNGDINKVSSHISILYMHLIKWKYQPERRSSSWCNSIINNSVSVNDLCYDKKKKKLIKIL